MQTAKTLTGLQVIDNRGWVRKYTNRLGVRELECDVCKQVLRLPPGIMGNMRRHFKSKHPFIYAKETNQDLDSDVEYEKEEEQCDIIESDVEEETHEKDETLTATGKKVIHKRGWVRKYSKKIGDTEHEC
ncbi:Zinc finger BED domain-containing protein 6, partial [Operophtera brumata]